MTTVSQGSAGAEDVTPGCQASYLTGFAIWAPSNTGTAPKEPVSFHLETLWGVGEPGVGYKPDATC